MAPRPPVERPTASEVAGREKGPVCPACGCRDIRVNGTWRVLDSAIFAKRARYCRHCGYVFPNTKEVVDE
jgi:hypothetical protein